MANNHIYDYGHEGTHRTKQAILKRGMTPLGTGRTLNECPEIYLWQGPEQVRVGFWAAANITPYPATRERTGVDVATKERALLALREMKRQGAQCCIALLHAGLQRTSHPDPSDIRVIDSMGSCGFDVVAATHSHRISGHKLQHRLDGTPFFFFYGLGSLISGAINSVYEHEGLIAVIGLNNRGAVVNVELRPVFLQKSGWGTIPTHEIGQEILERFVRLTTYIADGSYERFFYADMADNLINHHLCDFLAAYRVAGIRGVTQKLHRFRLRHVRRLTNKVLGYLGAEHLHLDKRG